MDWLAPEARDTAVSLFIAFLLDRESAQQYLVGLWITSATSIVLFWLV
ncbi:hypothetical protein [Nostoc sp.]